MSAVSGNSDSKSKLVVRRTMDDDIKMRDLYVTIDETPEKTLLFPRAFEVELSPGEHKIRITNRLFTKEESFRVRTGETVTYQVGNVVKGGIFGMIAASLTAAYQVKLERVSGE